MKQPKTENRIKTILFSVFGSEMARQKYIPQKLTGICHLIIAEYERGVLIALIGIEKRKLEMLLIAPKERGCGLGKKLYQRVFDS